MHRRVLKRRPPFLFRYRPPSEVATGYLEDLLRKDRIWASSPRDFCDWYDCRAEIDYEGTRAEWFRHWNRQFKLLGLRGRALSRQTSQAMTSGLWKDPNKHIEIANGIQAGLDTRGVICLTDTAMVERMWDEYADHHKGICLGFDSSEEPFSTTWEVHYLLEHPRVRFNAGGDELVEAFLLAKTNPYAWEREWRYVGYEEAHTHRPITNSALRAVVLGSRMEVNVRDEVVRLVSTWKPDVLLFALVTSGSANHRLEPLDRAPASYAGRIIPPIQERGRGEPLSPASGSEIVRLLDYAASVAPVHRRQGLDTRIKGLATELDAARRSGRNQESAARAFAALKEAVEVLRAVVNPDGSVVAGYGDVAVALYQLVYVGAISPGFLERLDTRLPT